MKLKRFRGWYFTESELYWLSLRAVDSELAANILVRYNRRYGRKVK